MPAPVLETARLRLRPFRKQDFRPYHALLQHPEVHKHFGPDPMGEEECWRRVAASIGMWDLLGFGGWAVVRKSDERLVGTISLFNSWRALDPVFGEDPEMGWIFAKDVHGQGLAGEAGRAVLDWADATLVSVPLWAIISPHNAPSFRLADRLGFERVHNTLYQEEPITVLRRAPRAI